MWAYGGTDGRTSFPTEAMCEPGKERRSLLTIVIHISVVRGSPSETWRDSGKEKEWWS